MTAFLPLDTPEAAQLWLQVTKWLVSVLETSQVTRYLNEFSPSPLCADMRQCLPSTARCEASAESVLYSGECLCLTAATVSTGDWQYAGWQHKHTDTVNTCTTTASDCWRCLGLVPCSGAVEQQLSRKESVSAHLLFCQPLCCLSLQTPEELELNKQLDLKRRKKLTSISRFHFKKHNFHFDFIANM